MKIPLKYNLRSLWVRKTSTAMAAFGIGLTVAIVIVLGAMIHGLDTTFLETGDPVQLVVIRKGSQNEVNSYFNRDLFESVRLLDGIARDEQKQPLAAGEIVVVINYEKLTDGASNITMRGTSDDGFVLRPSLEIVEGRRFRKGLREVIVSHTLSSKFRDMTLGSDLTINDAKWRVVGVFRSGTAYDSEIWADYQQIAQAWQRSIYNSILLRATSLETARQLIDRIENDRRIQLDAIPQKEYFAAQTISSAGLKALAVFIASIIWIGACFAVMNMMYGAVAARRKEIATLRSLGFRRRSILASFLVESFILATLGAAVGCGLGSLFNGYTAGAMNFSSFAEVMFRFKVTPDVLLRGVVFAQVAGVLGGFLPAYRAARTGLLSIMRD